MERAPLTIDPALFRPEAVSEETRAFNRMLAERGGPGLADMGVEKARQGGLMPPPVRSDRGEDRTIRGPGGAPLGLRVVAPDTPRGVYLHLHGGGLILGSADGQDARLAEIADATGLACVSVDYRLAPEHPYPAAWDDAEAAALWLARNGAAEFGGAFLAIGGESAGATLAVPTLLRMRDRHGFTGFGAAALSYGNYDSSGTPSNHWNGRDGLIIRDVDIAYCTQCYAPDPATRRDPDMSALYADLRDMPPALFSVGTLDCFLDDSLFLAARWVAAGNAAEIALYPGGIHGFTSFPYALGREANARIDTFLAARLAEAGL
jgi:acetyl esterase/lipase